MEAVSLLGPVVEYTIKPVSRQVGYLFNYKSNVENLDRQTKDLVHAKQRLQHSIDQGLRQGHKIEADVEEWMRKVDDIIAEANQFLEGEEQAKKCLHRFCRYRPSRKATKLADKVDLEKGKEFPSVSYSRPPQDIWTTVGYQDFESRTSFVTQILEELKKDDIYMIGVYGMGGVGKTTLIKQVAGKAEEDKLFDNVVKVEVKQNTEVEKIQKEIAEKLDEYETETGRALILRNYIKEKKKVLVILDDIWEELDLEKLGIPIGMCKIMLTSRTREVLSSKMGTQKEFLLQVLKEEENWSLFVNTVGDAVKHPDFLNEATKIAKSCGGLPILVVTVAKALKRKRLNSWKEALRSLKVCDGQGMLEIAYAGIEWSYNQLDGDMLDGKDMKSLFLIVGMLGDQYYFLTDLLKYTMGLGLKLFKGINTIEEAYDKLHSLVDKLRDSCLLLDTHESDIVRIHDLTRDVARKIASRDQCFLSFGFENEFKEWPNKEFLQKCVMVSFDRINVPKLPQELECQCLHLFLINSIDKSLEIPPHFFKKMKQLRVLDLTNLCIPSLPPSIQSLTSLQTLCLDQCELRDIAIVGKLRNLQILSFLHSKFKQLPKEIGHLSQLRLLDLNYCPELEVIYPNVIKSLTKLEELKMNNNFYQWETEEASNNISERRNASLSELKHLPNLTTMYINIKDANQLPIDFFSEKLKHFKIFIGDVWDLDAEHDETSKKLKLKLTQRNQWDQGLETILNRCEDLSLDVFEGVKNIVYQLDMDGFQRLKKLHVQNNPEISHILNSNIGYSWIRSHAAFTILEALSLSNLVSLESLRSGQLAVESFRKLKVIKVQNCPKLKNLFSFSTVLHFLQLEEIEVLDCKSMKDIVDVDEQEKSMEVETNDPINFHGLQSLSLQSLPELTCFASNPNLHIITSTSSNPMQLFSEKAVFPKLENLKLSSIPLSKLWDDRYSSRMSWIQNLTSLIVEGCDGLSFLCSSSMAINFVQLKKLEINRCQNMVEIISMEEALGNLEKMDKMFSKLQTLKLEALEKLEIFCKSASYIEFPCLQFLDIKDCSKLGSFVIDSMSRKNVRDPAGNYLFDENVGFPNLEDLRMEGLHKLSTIWHTQIASDSFYKLTRIWVKSCQSLVRIVGPGILKRLHNLKELTLWNCESVQEVFNGDHDQSEVFRCQNLLEVVISNCKSLKILFPAPVARVLRKLEMLRIFKCEKLEVIIGEIIPKFVFPRLMWVSLCELPQLRSFYPGMHTSVWPSLRKLWLCPSDKHENLAVECSIFQQQQHEHDQLGTPTKLPILLFQKGSFRHLEEFHLFFRDGIELPIEFIETKRLYITCVYIASAVGLSVYLEKFHKRQLLELIYGNMEEIFINEGALDGEEQHVFAHLKSLEIYGMDNLIQVWKDNSNLAGPVFVNLEILKVGKCGRLKNLVSSAISFCNLVQLEVLECHGLKHLVTCSMAKSFVQLQSIRVEDCQRMLEFVASDDDDNVVSDADHGNEITFNRLKNLKLSNLPNLQGFCSRNYNVKFTFLTTLSVINCLEMKISPDGVLLNDSKHE